MQLAALCLLALVCAVRAIPQQVHIAVTGVPSEMSVMWMTQANTSTSIVNYGTSAYVLFCITLRHIHDADVLDRKFLRQ